MQFERSDFDWPDHNQLTLERFERYKKVIDGVADGLEAILLKHHGKFTLLAHVIPGIFSVAVRGDNRRVLPVVALESNRRLPYKLLKAIRQEVCQTLPVSRVIYRLDKRCPKVLVPP